MFWRRHWSPQRRAERYVGSVRLNRSCILPSAYSRMKQSETWAASSVGEDSRLRSAPSGCKAPTSCVDRRAKHSNSRSILSPKNIPLYRNSETAYVSRNPAQGRGAYRDRHDAGRAAVDVDPIGAKSFAGRATVSEDLAHTTGVIRVRQNRVVLAPGACAPSLAVMRVAQPGLRISHLQGDGGNSASLPGEITT